MDRIVTLTVLLVTLSWAWPGTAEAQEPAVSLTEASADLPHADLPHPLHEAFFDAKCRSDPNAFRDAGEKAARVAPRADKPLRQPHYPPSARRANKQGTTSLLLLVNEEGDVVKAVVERSSGHRELDQAALDAARRWHFTAPTLDGKPNCGWGRFATTFKTFDGDQEPLIYSQARELARVLLSTERMKNALLRAPLLNREPQVVRIFSQSQPNVLDPITSQAMLDHYAALLSSNLSREELTSIVAFYQTPAGASWMKVHAAIDRAVTDKLNAHLGSSACRIFMVQRSLGAEDSSAAGLSQAVPKVVATYEKFCDCAAGQFARALLVADDAGREKLLGEAQHIANCRLPAAAGESGQ